MLYDAPYSDLVTLRDHSIRAKLKWNGPRPGHFSWVDFSHIISRRSNPSSIITHPCSQDYHFLHPSNCLLSETVFSPFVDQCKPPTQGLRITGSIKSAINKALGTITTQLQSKQRDQVSPEVTQAPGSAKGITLEDGGERGQKLKDGGEQLRGKEIEERV